MGTLAEHIDVLKEAGKQCAFIPELFEFFKHIYDHHLVEKDTLIGIGVFLVDPTGAKMKWADFLQAIEAPLPPPLPPRKHFEPQKGHAIRKPIQGLMEPTK